MLNIIAWAVILITLADPVALWDVGMQLSTLATIGLVNFATPIEHVLARTLLRSTHLGWAREGLASTIAAQITTFPIMLCRLELPTIWSLLANTIITPVVPVAMACGTLFLVATLIHSSVAYVLAWIAYPCFAWIVTGSQVLATWPELSIMPIKLSTPWIELCLHACWVLGWMLRQRHDTHTS
jgi:competence protein ComEC